MSALANRLWVRAVYPARTLGQALASGDDNFFLLRFIAATMVIFGHSYVLSGIPGAGDFVARRLGPNIYTGTVAVDLFFVISGFLVTGSYVKRNNLEVFLRSRLLRILPAYAACLVLSAFVIGAVVTELPLGAYLGDPATRDYVYVNLQFGVNLRWSLPGVFGRNPYPNVVNGSIWTLPAEVRMYAWVAILGFFGVLRRRWLANIVLTVLLVIGLAWPERLPLVPLADFVPFAGFFAAGAFCFLNRDRIPLRTDLLLGLVVLAAFARRSAHFLPLLSVVLVYGCFWFAYRPRLGFFTRFGDCSYGLYLWGFPMQQIVISRFGLSTRPIVLFALSLPLALLCAIASWHLVEQPLLGLKTRSFAPAGRPARQRGGAPAADCRVETTLPSRTASHTPGVV